MLSLPMNSHRGVIFQQICKVFNVSTNSPKITDILTIFTTVNFQKKPV